MRTSLSRIREIENFIEGKMSGGEALIFQAKLLLDSELRQEVQSQRQTVSLIKLHGREKLRNEIEAIHQDIFNDNSDHFLRIRIRSLFINP
jgi:hypothetical protein